MYPKDKELEELKKVYDVVKSSPGLDFRDVQARARLDIKSTRTCINTLKDHSIIEERQDDETFRFFPSSGMSERDKKTMGLLRQFIPRQAVLYLLKYPNSKINDIAREVHTSSDSLSKHLDKLSGLGLVEVKRSGLSTSANITDPTAVVKLLIEYKESFLDKLVNKFIETWTEK